jgi:hypothetical protein
MHLSANWKNRHKLFTLCKWGHPRYHTASLVIADLNYQFLAAFCLENSPALTGVLISVKAKFIDPFFLIPSQYLFPAGI